MKNSITLPLMLSVVLAFIPPKTFAATMLIVDGAGLAEPDPFVQQEVQRRSDAFMVEWERQHDKRYHGLLHHIRRAVTAPIRMVATPFVYLTNELMEW